MWMQQSCHIERTLAIRVNDSSTTVYLPVQTPVLNHPVWATSGALGHVQRGMSHLKAHLSGVDIYDYIETWRWFFPLEEKGIISDLWLRTKIISRGYKSFIEEEQIGHCLFIDISQKCPENNISAAKSQCQGF